MSTRTKLTKFIWKWAAPVAGLTALALAFYLYFRSPKEPVYILRATAGDALGMRHRLAQALKTELAEQGIRLEPYGTKGSEEALDLVNSRTLDVALIQGGLRANLRPNVRQVLALHMEALHLLVKKELFEEVSKHLGALEGKTVNVGEVGSGTHSLASETLAFAGLYPRGAEHPRGYIPYEKSREQLYHEKDRNLLPDAVMLVSVLPSTTARFLVTERGYVLTPVPFGEAFALEARAAEEPGVEPKGSLSLVDKGHTYPTSIPAFTYSVEPPVPPQTVATLGTRLLIVAHKDVDLQVIRRFVEAALASHVAKTGNPPIDARILDIPPEFPWHDGTKLYRQRNEPVVSGALMDSAHKAFAILAAAASGLFVLWQWSRLRGQFMRDKGFNKYISQVNRIEQQAVQAECGNGVGREQLEELRAQIHRLKIEALDRFTDGELAGKELLAGFLTQADDARDYVTRLIRRQNKSFKQ
jgi:TRAP-type uncharacterized transport system substrate-binding protein